MRVPSLLLSLAVLAACLPARSARAADDFSVAERALFMENHLAGLKPPLTLHYTFRRAGSLEEGFEDKVSLTLTRQADGGCCAASTKFLSGPRQLALPDVESAQGNPLILYFLERDIREMQRLTKGQQNYFRKRIRMAAYQGAQVRPATLQFRGRSIAGQVIEIAPYLDDPLRARFEKLANKRYVFTLSDAVPGGVYSIRSQVAGASADAPALLVEDLLADGAAPASADTKP
jgi:hypothetical protein